MDYEKEYNDALERASIIYTGEYKPEIAAFCKQTLEAVFPELEDYSDMRIIKEITFFLKQKGAYHKEWIDWLEKLAPNPQGKSALEAIKEEKVDNVNKVETKFKVGDWVVRKNRENFSNGRKAVQITDIAGEQYWLDCGTWLEAKDIRLWTIQDAEDGDVLVNGANIFIFHCIEGTRFMGYCHLNTGGWFFYNDIGKNECFCLTDAVVTPATKEQRDLLFQKMRDAGYEWDADNKQLIIL